MTTAPPMTTAFTESLRRWRAVRKLSQLDLALRAQTTQRHLSFLESGRSAPGRDLTLRLGQALELTLRQRNALLAAAGFVPEFAESGLDGPALAAVRAAIEAILTGNLPSPAVVTRAPGVVVAGNSAMRLLTDGAAEHLLTPPVNVFRLALHPQGMAPRIANFAEWAPHVINAFDRRAERDDSAQLAELADELRAYLPAEARPGRLSGMVAPMLLRTAGGTASLITTRMTFANAADVTLDELELEAFLPADTATAQLLRTAASSPSRMSGSARMRAPA